MFQRVFKTHFKKYNTLQWISKQPARCRDKGSLETLPVMIKEADLRIAERNWKTEYESNESTFCAQRMCVFQWAGKTLFFSSCCLPSTECALLTVNQQAVHQQSFLLVYCTLVAGFMSSVSVLFVRKEYSYVCIRLKCVVVRKYLRLQSVSDLKKNDICIYIYIHTRVCVCVYCEVINEVILRHY